MFCKNCPTKATEIRNVDEQKNNIHLKFYLLVRRRHVLLGSTHDGLKVHDFNLKIALLLSVIFYQN